MTAFINQLKRLRLHSDTHTTVMKSGAVMSCNKTLNPWCLKSSCLSTRTSTKRILKYIILIISFIISILIIIYLLCTRLDNTYNDIKCQWELFQMFQEIFRERNISVQGTLQIISVFTEPSFQIMSGIMIHLLKRHSAIVVNRYTVLPLDKILWWTISVFRVLSPHLIMLDLERKTQALTSTFYRH